MRHALPIATLILAVVSGGIVRADTRKAKAHFEQATKLYNLNRFDEALKEYEAAYLEKNDAAFLYNIAQCHRQLGHKSEAVGFYKNFLRNAPDAARREDAEQRIVELEAGMAAEAASKEAQPPPPAPTLPPAPSPSPAPAPETTGRSGPEVATLTAAAPATEEPKPLTHRWWFWAAIGAAVVGGVVIGLVATRPDNKDPSCPAGTLACK